MKKTFALTLATITASKSFAYYGDYSSSSTEMPGWLTFIGIVMIVWGILEIILFFKIWGMTNDVRKLTKKICVPESKSQVSIETMGDNDVLEGGDYDKRLDYIKSGDKVLRKSDGKIIEVDSVEGKRLFCKCGSFEGYKWYQKNSVEYIED
ncbi:M penetrans paralogue family 26 [Prevotella communis]|uniref:M penetrans paralogue family 26 n=1 Tax=Prevotella communis TaxID=2913614 RepID=A0A1H0EFY7_9BACT|nr:hypothetical protein [Prevotella communis]SDN81231.1 M penetrans paralogue family 26 [Prevotella communis]